MTRQQREPIWPFLFILVCLFTWCILTPQRWEQFATEAPWENSSRLVASLPSATAPRAMALQPSVESLRGTDDSRSDAVVPLVAQRAAAGTDAGTGPVEHDFAAAQPSFPDSVTLSPGELKQVEPADHLGREAVIPGPETAPETDVTLAPHEQKAIEPAPPPGVEPAPEEIAIETADPSWPTPASLLARLDRLAQSPAAAAWAASTSRLVRDLGAAAPLDAERAMELAGQLHAQGRAADVLAEELDSRPPLAELRRTQHALARRLDVWWRVIAGGGPAQSASAPVLWPELLMHIEEVEAQGATGGGLALAADCARLRQSPVTAHHQLAERLEIHYRNANLRLAVSDDFVNRLMPQREPELTWVTDRVLGKPVHGPTAMAADVLVRFIPDRRRLRLALDVEGVVQARTTASAGPATFLNDSESFYSGWKELELDLAGVRTNPARVYVANETQLRGLRTDLDPIPLLGPLVREVARSQHQQRQGEAQAEVRQKVAWRARRQIDNEAETQFADVNRRLQEKVLAPLGMMGVEPALVEAETTEHEMTMRLRLAGDEQLAASTPRPQAPEGSLVSVQIHESALNNVIAGLELAGRTFTLAQLREHLAERLERPELNEQASENDDVIVTFATDDPVAVRCEDGEISIRLKFVSLIKAPRRWNDFQLRARYRPVAYGREAELVREGVVELTGSRLPMRAQIALRGVASKIFAPDEPIALTPEKMREDKRLIGLAITQFTVVDGWIGAALGEEAADARETVAQRPAR